MNLAHFSSFGVAVAVYLIGTAMPGPGNLSIANASLNYGRMPGLATAAGVISGSLCWGVTAAAGVSAMLLGVPLISVHFSGVGRSSRDRAWRSAPKIILSRINHFLMDR
ncbi:hypothetical protein [Burkholderia vietnamiensis]|uniref:hypothetical protein n=1 Tax=Burkholderia vietnamiensis TaxID=60552 RepID=UPI000AF125C7|nr:hypothetical protein [Burkholderia vietnamiensis]